MRPIVLIALALTAMLAPACSDDPTTPPTPVDTTVTLRADMRPDSTVGWLYYSIDGDSVVPSDRVGTADWDIAMAYLQCCGKTRTITIRLNSGTAGTGQTQGGLIANRFENVSALGGTTLRNDDTLNPVIAFGGPNNMWAYDGVPNHTLSPVPDRVAAIRTRRGKLVKFQFTSIYEGAPSVPTQLTPIGYYHFRYAQLNP